MLADTDGDGLPDADEVDLGTNPLAADTDGDGTPDGQTSLDTVATIPDTGVTFTATGKGADVAGITVKKLPAQRLGDVPGQRGPPIDVTAPSGKVTGTLTIPFDTTDLPADADLAVLHYDEATGTFDRPTDQTVDLAAGVATVTTDQFSPFLVADTTRMRDIFAKQLVPPREDVSAPLDTALVIDSSGTMLTNDPTGQRRAAAKTFAGSLGRTDRVAVVDFDGDARLLQGLTTDKTAAQAALDTIDSNGTTDLNRGIQVGVSHFASLSTGGQRRVAVVLTDGPTQTYNPSLTDAAVQNDVTVYTIGVGPDADAAVLRDLAHRTGGLYLPVGAADATALRKAFEAITDHLGSPDTDGDGLADVTETAGWRDGAGRVYVTDPDNADTDGDGLTDGFEAGLPLPPPLTEEPPIILHTYEPGHGIRQGAPFGAGTYYKSYSDPTRIDSDGDGLGDAQELDVESHPRLPDTDFDGLDDLVEIGEGFDPLEGDADGDGRYDDQELADGSDPFLYDYTKAESLAAAVGGLAFGDAWDTEAAQFFGITADLAASPWYLVGTLVSGYAVVGDVRDLVYNAGTGAWGSAAIAAVAFVPVGGDAIKTVADVVAFARKGPRAARAAIMVAERVLPAEQVSAAIRQVAKLPNARLLRDAAVSGRTPRAANYDIDAGDWADGVPRTISKDPKQDAELRRLLQDLGSRHGSGSAVISDVRVNQRQVGGEGTTQGLNRPDLQYTENGVRYHVELDRPICKGGVSTGSTRRGAAHELRIRANAGEEAIQVIRLVVGACE